jgi:type VI secretion system protein
MVHPTRTWWMSRAGCVAVALAVLAATSCGGAPASTRLLIEVSLVPHANHDSPIPVSFVAVKDPKFLERVGQLTAQQWFAQREQLHRDDPSGQLFTEWEWEYVPGYTPPPTVIEVDGGAIAAFVYARYQSPADHRIRIGPQRKFRIELGDEDLKVRSIDVDRSP